ncbi:MAG: hypothetical protein V7K32_06515 [Nostoc sp.]|uniref:hypothetical protein n=1 Tax=Nostoc sp. TaxID=1180 RepID=UPI002FF465F4
MKTKLTCPVCDRQEIVDDICPNCETNLHLMRILVELPSQPRGVPVVFVVLIAIACLILGILCSRVFVY